MAPIASIIPGASYSLGTFSIPVSALTTASGLSIPSADRFEYLLYGLLASLKTKQDGGTVSQVTCAAEISARSVSNSVWETSLNTFSDVYLVNFLASFPFTTMPSETPSAMTSIGN